MALRLDSNVLTVHFVHVKALQLEWRRTLKHWPALINIWIDNKLLLRVDTLVAHGLCRYIQWP